MLYRVEGIVIRSIEYGEGNVIVTLFTEAYGKVGVMVRGAKKTRSRHAAVTQLYTYGEYVYYKSNSGTLGTLNNAELLDVFHGIRSDLRCSAYAAYFSELTDRLVPDGEASAYVFEQLKAALTRLSEGKDPMIIAFLLEMKLLHFAGISPVTDGCASCDSTPLPEEPVYWNVPSGGLLCRRCNGRGGIHSAAAPLHPAAVKLLPILQRADIRHIGDIRVKPATKSAIKQALREWMDIHADIRLKTRTVLEQIDAVYET